MALAKKFDVVKEAHQFLFKFLFSSGDMSYNACRQTYVLDSMIEVSEEKMREGYGSGIQLSISGVANKILNKNKYYN